MHQLSAHQAAAPTSRSFFPRLISGPSSSALEAAITFALLVSLAAAGASRLRAGVSLERDDDESAPGAHETAHAPPASTPAERVTP